MREGVQWILYLIIGWLGIYLQAASDFLRPFLGVHPHLAPALLICAVLQMGRARWVPLAVLWGLWQDALSANPMGVSAASLLVVGLGLDPWKQVLLKERAWTRGFLGIVGGAIYPVLTLILVLSRGGKPLLGWGFLVAVGVWSLSSGVLAAVFYPCIEKLTDLFAYPEVERPSIRLDREIIRGRD